MADAPKQTWYGASGKPYEFSIFGLEWTPKPGQDGNYIFAEHGSDGTWYAIYIGEGDLRDRKADHIHDGCVLRKNATHFHCHLNSDERARLAEEDDLLAGNMEAYEPEGCNVRKGG